MSMKLFCCILSLATLGALGGCGNHIAQSEGRAEADREWAGGVPTVYTYGLRDGTTRVDADFGLPYNAVGGCVVADDFLARVDGHNARIAELVGMHGLPACSWKLREPGVLAIARMWKERVVAGESPRTLAAAGIVVGRGHGSRVVGLGEYQEGRDGKLWPLRTLTIDAVECYSSGIPAEGDIEALGGEKTADVIYLRWTVKGSEAVFRAMDLKGNILRGEVESR